METKLDEILKRLGAIESDIRDIRGNIEKQNYKIGMIQAQGSGPNSFLDALSPASIIGYARRTNPAYKE